MQITNKTGLGDLLTGCPFLLDAKEGR